MFLVTSWDLANASVQGILIQRDSTAPHIAPFLPLPSKCSKFLLSYASLPPFSLFNCQSY